MIQNKLWKKVVAAYLPVVVFLPIYVFYLDIYYTYVEDVPLENKNFGFVLLAVLFIVRSINLSKLPKSNSYMDLYNLNKVFFNMVCLLASWLLIGNIMALMELIAPFRDNMIVHIFIIFFVSFILSGFASSTLMRGSD
ncbi:hypothetical protein [Hymenobacter antarcticus]|uniref:Uncharacterized protein n=1 Tax=Hymenobacter antarcticus TaxID=486270 RepID=A0ABP7PMN7_9BACT